MGILTLSLDSEVVVRLAHEGVPVQVIARATRIPVDEVRLELQEAHFAGRLPDLIGSNRAKPARLAPPPPDNVAAVQGLQTAFCLTPIQAAILLLLLRNSVVNKYDSIVGPRCFDVHIFHLRQRLEPFKLKILTLRGQGYQISVVDRRRAADLVSQHIAAQAIL